MAAITVKVENKKVSQSLKIVGDAIPRLSNKRMLKAMENARDEVRTYPAERPNQRYKRTYKRYDATKVVKAANMSYRIESNPRYGGRTANPYVIGDSQGQGQAWMHQGRWKVLKEVVDKWVETLTTEIKADISQLLRGEGFGM